jgi:HNH endonuclease
MSAYISVELQKQIRDKFANCCAYCLTAEFLTATTFEFEHIIPRSSGGETVVENLCLACPSCNRYKAVRVASLKENRQNVIDRVNEQTIPFFHPQFQAWSEHFSWNEDASEIVGVTDVGRVTIEALKMNRSQLVRVRKMWVVLGEHPPKS